MPIGGGIAGIVASLASLQVINENYLFASPAALPSFSFSRAGTTRASAKVLANGRHTPRLQWIRKGSGRRRVRVVLGPQFHGDSGAVAACRHGCVLLFSSTKDPA
jgi:hypothetical protein